MSKREKKQPRTIPDVPATPIPDHGRERRRRLPTSPGLTQLHNLHSAPGQPPGRTL